MKKSRFTDSQIMSILKQAEAGTVVAYRFWPHKQECGMPALAQSGH